MSRKRELPDWDDGRTIVNMDVEGMPWNNRPSYLRRAVQSLRDKKQNPSSRQEEMTDKESRYYTWGAVKAGLLVVGIFAATIVLFILLCQKLWFRS